MNSAASLALGFSVKKIGHLGTLDPFATGLLPLCVGRGTRLSHFLDQSRKVYEAELVLLVGEHLPLGALADVPPVAMVSPPITIGTPDASTYPLSASYLRDAMLEHVHLVIAEPLLH